MQKGCSGHGEKRPLSFIKPLIHLLFCPGKNLTQALAEAASRSLTSFPFAPQLDIHS